VIDLDALTEVKRTALPKDQFEIKLTLVEKTEKEGEEDITTLYDTLIHHTPHHTLVHHTPYTHTR
jgi:hypothetical protein